MKVFVAGASGAVGRRLVPQLVAGGHKVVATTRSEAKLNALRQLGAHAVVVDGLDAAAVGSAVAQAEPEVIVHQMTALAVMGSPRRFDQVFAQTNRLRTEGLDHLLAAAKATGVRKVIAQSYIGWNNRREGGAVKTEADGLDPDPAPAQRRSLAAIEYLERTLADCSDVETVALRYGFLYGPGSSESVVAPIRKRRIPLRPRRQRSLVLGARRRRRVGCGRRAGPGRRGRLQHRRRRSCPGRAVAALPRRGDRGQATASRTSYGWSGWSAGRSSFACSPRSAAPATPRPRPSWAGSRGGAAGATVSPTRSPPTPWTVPGPERHDDCGHLRRPAVADVLHRVPHAGQRRRSRGHRQDAFCATTGHSPRGPSSSHRRRSCPR